MGSKYSLKEIARLAHESAKNRGLPVDGDVLKYYTLIFEELKELLDAYTEKRYARRGLELNELKNPQVYDNWVKDTVEDELCDIIILALSLSSQLRINIDSHVRAKIHYNDVRER